MRAVRLAAAVLFAVLAYELVRWAVLRWLRIGVERLSRRAAGGAVRVGPHPHAVELLEYHARSLSMLDAPAGARPLPAASAG
jgi:HEAT repeat protein